MAPLVSSVIGRGRVLVAAPVLLALALGLGACGALTTGASNVTATSADLHATAHCDKAETCTWYWEYWPASQPRSSSTKTQVYGPVGQSPPNVPLTRHISGLDPNTAYRWVFCGSINGGANYLCAGPHGHFDGPSADPPSDYDTFTTAPGDWNLQATPSPAGTNATLSSVSCASTTLCKAVGSYRSSSGTTVTLAENWGGGAWTIRPTPNPAGATASYLQRVSCSSASACIAVGYSTGAAGNQALAERWDGSAWTILPTPAPPGGAASQLFGVSCTSATACTAVGNYSVGGANSTLAERWNGLVWTIQNTPNPAGGGHLAAVSCTSATSCTAVGYLPPIGENWNGSTWTPETIPAPVGALLGLSCTSSTECSAAGIGSGAFDFNTAVASWNGSTWTANGGYTPLGGSLFDVSCSATTACAAVGQRGGGGAPIDRLAQRWDGTTWTTQSVQVPAGASGSSLNGVSCVSGAPCTAVGFFQLGSTYSAFVVRSSS